MNLFEQPAPPAHRPCPAPPPPAKRHSHAMRDYQRRAVDRIGLCLKEEKSTLLVMATGCGKTVCIAHAIKAHCPGRALVIAHRQELIYQNAKTIEAVMDEGCAIEMGDVRADLNAIKRKVIVASKDSLHEKRISRFNPSEFDLIVTDECHHSPSDSYRDVYKYFAGVPHLGVTATPNRLDEAALGQVFSSVAMTYEISDAINDGYLVPVLAYTAYVGELNLVKVKTTAGEFNQGELAQQMENEQVLHKVALTVTEKSENRRAIIFTVSVLQAEMLVEVLNDYKEDSARMVCGTTPIEQRQGIIRAHKANEFQYLVNCAILTEGYDDPGCSMIVIAKPTKSQALFSQMIGRGTRALPGIVDGLETPGERKSAIAASDKPNLLVLDFTGNCGKHKLASCADALGGNYPDEDIEAAAAMMRDGEADVSECLEKARQDRVSASEEIQHSIEELKARRARIITMAKYLLEPADLFDGDVVMARERDWGKGKPPTDPQLDTLERAGFARVDMESLNRQQCSRLIGEVITRRMKGLSTLKQCRALAKRGIDAKAMSFAQASAEMDRLYGGRRGFIGQENG